MRHIFTTTIILFLVTAGFFYEAKGTVVVTNGPTSFHKLQDPVFKDYRGVTIGMSADDVRQKLGKPEDQSDTEDSFKPADGENTRIIYNAEKKVKTISIMYTDDVSKAPSTSSIVGEDVPANEGGGIFKRVDYPDQGFWITYAKIAGDDPMIIITIQAL